MRRHLFLIVALVGLAAAGCTHVVTTMERRASFAPHADKRIGAEPTRIFLQQHVGVLIGGAQLSHRIGPDGQLAEIQLQAEDPAQLGFGSVTPIDQRGYLLTAGHCVVREPVFLVFSNGRTARVEKARVVWRGDVDKHEPDLALLHVTGPVDSVLEWAANFKSGDDALAVGLDYDQALHYDVGCAAGKITKIDPQPKSVPAYEYIYHAAPLHGGDSGGPLTSVDGKLIAVNTGAGSLQIGPFVHLVSRAERPDLGWLRQRIEEDFARESSTAH